MKKLTENEMFDMLADYAFSRLSSEDKIIFEANLPNFPEAANELAQVQNVVLKLEAMNIDEHLSRKTRNIPFFVADRLEKRSVKMPFSRLFRIAVPAFTMIFIVGFSFWMLNNNSSFESSNTKENTEKTQVFTDADAFMFVDSNAAFSEIKAISTELAANASPSQIEVLYEDDSLLETLSYKLMGDKLLSAVSQDEDFCLYNSLNSDYYSILDDIENIDEVQFQLLLKEIKDEKSNN